MATADPVVGVVEGHMICLSDEGRAVPQLPDNLRGLPFDTLFPMVLDRIIDHQDWWPPRAASTRTTIRSSGATSRPRLAASWKGH